MSRMLWIYLAALNLLAFALFGIDKKRAREHAWRISEAALFVSALVGGSAGAVIGMYFWHHKTRKWYFRYGLPIILAAQLVILWRVLGG